MTAVSLTLLVWQLVAVHTIAVGRHNYFIHYSFFLWIKTMNIISHFPKHRGLQKKTCLANNISTFCLPVPGREHCPVTCTHKANTKKMLRDHFRYHIQSALDMYNKYVNKGAIVVLRFFLLTSWNEPKSLCHVITKQPWDANKACLLSRQYTMPDRGMKVSYSAVFNHRDHLML